MSKQEENFISYVHRLEAEHKQLIAILSRLKCRLSHENISNANIDLMAIIKEADKITERLSD